jgi:hypothetical protein
MNRRKILEITGLAALAGMLWPARGEAGARPDHLRNAVLAKRMIRCHAITARIAKIDQEISALYDSMPEEIRGISSFETPEREPFEKKLSELCDKEYDLDTALFRLLRLPIDGGQS